MPMMATLLLIAPLIMAPREVRMPEIELRIAESAVAFADVRMMAPVEAVALEVPFVAPMALMPDGFDLAAGAGLHQSRRDARRRSLA